MDRPVRPTTTKELSSIMYSDFSNNLGIHPVTGNITRVINQSSVKQALRNLILTNTGERLYKPDMGLDLTKYLFENIISDTDNFLIKNKIIKLIEIYEPRVELLDVQVLTADSMDKVNAVTGNKLNDYDLYTGGSSNIENSMIINIIFRIINTNEQLNVNVIVERNR